MTGGWELTPPLRNRFVHIQWELSPKAYISGLENGFPDAELYDIPVDKHAEILPSWKLKIAAFLRRQPSLLETSPDNDMYGFASPRSWEFVAALMASCEILGQAPIQGQVPTQACMTLLRGCIGEGAALPFLEFLKNLKLPDPEKVLDGEIEADISGFNDSELYVFFGSITNVITTRYQDSKMLMSCFKYFDIIKKVNKNGRRDLIYSYIRKAAKGNLLMESMRVAGESSQEDRTKMLAVITEVFSDKALEKYINIFEND